MLEDADADLVQVLQEAVEDGHQMSGGQLIAQDQSQFVDGERQRPPHLPLTHTRAGLRTCPSLH